MFDRALKSKHSCWVKARPREFDQAEVLNAIGLTYQSLGFHVLLLSSRQYCGEYYVEGIITDESQLLGRDFRKIILLIDEQSQGDKLPEKLKDVFFNYEILTVGFIICLPKSFLRF